MGRQVCVGVGRQARGWGRAGVGRQQCGGQGSVRSLSSGAATPAALPRKDRHSPLPPAACSSAQSGSQSPNKRWP